MSASRLDDYLGHMARAAAEAVTFVAGVDKARFLGDRMMQQAVLMNIVIVGEAAARILEQYPDYAEVRADVPWRAMRNMRNRLTHGYFEVNLDIVWDTVNDALPGLLATLRSSPQSP